MNILEEEIIKHKKEIHSDAYPMSIGEAVSLYQNGELEIHPEFQRVFRWSNEKKSKFIESILLGIPIPSFFVSQRDDGVWDLVDGLQRFSTILAFMGELKDENGEQLPALELSKGDYLESLAGVRWDDEEKFTKPMKLSFRREKIDFKIIKKESTIDTKYELFKRINTGGAPLTDQEVRNCILLMINREFYLMLDELSKKYYFRNSISISDDKILEQYHIELVVRFFVFFIYIKADGQNERISNLTNFLDNKIYKLARSRPDFTYLQTLFENTFRLIDRVMGSDAFRKYYPKEQRHKGGFSIALFEAISIGVAKNIDSFSSDDRLREAIENFSENEIFSQASGAGVRASTRILQTIPYAIQYFHEYR